MRIIISPAKKMVEDDGLPWEALPVYINKAQELKNYIQSLSPEEAKELWQCNDKIADLNYQRFSCMSLEKNLSPAILSYDGIQYQHIAPGVFDTDSMEYIQQHLRILSGFYGVLKPYDGITPYRLEMQSKVNLYGYKDLYDFWGEDIYREVIKNDNVILDLASKEYSKSVKPYLKPEDKYITCIFGEYKNNKVIQKATLAKMARGEMVRYLAERNIQSLDEVKDFNILGFMFNSDLSSESEYVFIKA